MPKRKPTRKNKPFMAYLTPDQLLILQQISANTGLPQTVIVRDGVDMAIRAFADRVPDWLKGKIPPARESLASLCAGMPSVQISRQRPVGEDADRLEVVEAPPEILAWSGYLWPGMKRCVCTTADAERAQPHVQIVGPASKADLRQYEYDGQPLLVPPGYAKDNA